MATFREVLVLVMPVLICSHSWVDMVGDDGGRMRGYQRGLGDLFLQRYICDRPRLSQCQPPPKHGIVLTDDAMFPCRSDSGSHLPTRVAAGGQLHVTWMGNGHANAQSLGAPVHFYISPYWVKPAMSDFKPLALNVPYFHCEDGATLCDRPKTDFHLPIPVLDSDGNQMHGTYTILWKWPFTDFIFASCFDIEVLSPGSATTSVPLSTVAVDEPSGNVGTERYQQYGCTYDAECRGVGEEYCKLWLKDECGRSVCHAADHLRLFPCESTSSPGSSAPVTECGPWSYCKCWLHPHVCQGSDLPCVCADDL